MDEEKTGSNRNVLIQKDTVLCAEQVRNKEVLKTIVTKIIILLRIRKKQLNFIGHLMIRKDGAEILTHTSYVKTHRQSHGPHR